MCPLFKYTGVQPHTRAALSMINFPDARHEVVDYMANYAETPAVALDREGRIIWASQSTVSDLCRFFGEFDHSLPSMIMRNPANAAFASFAQSAMTTGKPASFTGTFKTCSGDDVHATCRFAPHVLSDGTPFVRASFTDETTLQRVRRDLSTNNKLKNTQTILAIIAATLSILWFLVRPFVQDAT